MDAIKKPIYDYVEGWYDKDPERMKRGLHPDLAKRSIDTGESNGIRKIDLASLLSVIDQFGGQHGSERKIDIEILDIYGDIATAKVTSNEYVDYVHLCNLNGQWRILNVLWAFQK